MKAGDDKVAVEIFAAKGLDTTGLFMAVSRRCGLSEADTLMLNGNRLLAMRQQTILPIDFPLLNDTVRARVESVVHAGGQLTVSEFSACGLYDAYFLNLVKAE